MNALDVPVVETPSLQLFLLDILQCLTGGAAFLQQSAKSGLKYNKGIRASSSLAAYFFTSFSPMPPNFCSISSTYIIIPDAWLCKNSSHLHESALGPPPALAVAVAAALALALVPLL